VFGPDALDPRMLPAATCAAVLVTSSTSLIRRTRGRCGLLVVWQRYKAALRSVAIVVAGSGALGIKVTIVAPGAFMTDFLSDHSIHTKDPLLVG